MSDQNTSTHSVRSSHSSRLQRAVRVGFIGLSMLIVSAAASAQAYVGGSVSGQLAPGVYGRVDIGNAPAPAVIYQQPVIIAPPQMAMQGAPVYMYVPPGHAKHWGKHCGRYGACGQRVYFLKNPPRYHSYRGHDRDRDHGYRDRDRRHWRDSDRHDRHDHDRDRDRRHHGHGHGRD